MSVLPSDPNFGREVRHEFSLGAAIYVAIKPMVKIYLSIGIGFLMARKNILTPDSQSVIGQMVLRVFSPCIIFYNIIQYIEDRDIKLLAIIMLTGFLYYGIGVCFALLCRLTLPIPRGWFGGLILITTVGNSGDLPVAYVQTFQKAKQIPVVQGQRGVAFIQLFMIVFTLVTFNLGGTRLVKWDFEKDEPHRDMATIPPISFEKVKLYIKNHLQHKHDQNTKPQNASGSINKKDESDKGNGSLELKDHDQSENRDPESLVPYDGNDTSRKHDERQQSNTLVRSSSSLHNRHGNEYSSQKEYITGNVEPDNAADEEAQSKSGKIVEEPQPKTRLGKKWAQLREKNMFTRIICHFIEDMRQPQMMALISSVSMCMIPWVKRCFSKQQHISGWHDPPDGNPPLDFLMDLFSFMAGAQVPLGLMMLGATLGRLKVTRLIPGFWKTAAAIAIFKLAILPIIACAWISRLEHDHWISDNDVILPIVMGVNGGVPSATIQIYLTNMYIGANPDSPEMNSLAVCLIAQYAILPITMPILVTYIIKNLM